MKFLKLADVAALRLGHSFRGSIAPDASGNALALQPRDVAGHGQIEWACAIRTTIARPREAQWLRTGDVIFAARGARWVAAAVDHMPEPAVCSQYFFLLRIHPHVPLLPAFLAWQINQGPAQRHLAAGAEGSNQAGIRRAVLEALPVAVPPQPRQQAALALAAAARSEQQLLQALIRHRQRQLDAVAQSLLAPQSPPYAP